MKKIKPGSIILNIIIYLGLFFIIFKYCITNLDVDFGWHLRVGKDIMQNIFPRTDIYTFTHSGHSWVDHEWLADLLTYIIYQKTNFVFLAGCFSLIIISLFLIETIIINKILKIPNNILLFLAMFILLTVLVPFIAIRMQVLSWLGIIIVILILLQHYYQGNKIGLYFLPLLFLIWANLHGGFPLALTLLAIYFFFTKKDKKTTAIIFFLSCLTTLINPYGVGIWKEVLQTFFDSYGKSKIVEWGSIINYPINLVDIGYIIFFLVIILLRENYKDIPLFYRVFLVMTLILGFLSKRNFPIFAIISFPYLLLGINNLVNKKYFLYDAIKICTVTFFTIVAGLSLLIEPKYLIIDPYKNSEIYPYKTATYLQENKIFSKTAVNFSWGGYLLWNMPSDYQVFYDGRMVHWHSEKTRFLTEYLDFMSGKNWEEIAKKYEIKNIIIEKESFVARLKTTDKINKLFYGKLINSLKPENNNLFTKLKENPSWRLIYENEESYIFQKK